MCSEDQLLTWQEPSIRISAILVEVPVSNPRSVELLSEDAEEGGASLRARHVALQGPGYHQIDVGDVFIHGLKNFHVLRTMKIILAPYK